MAKGARNKKKLAWKKVRRAKFAPREAATLVSIAPNLDLIREKLAEQKEIDLQREKEAKLEKLAEAENGMAEEKEKSHLDASNFDPKTKQDKDGKYSAFKIFLRKWTQLYERSTSPFSDFDFF